MGESVLSEAIGVIAAALTDVANHLDDLNRRVAAIERWIDSEEERQRGDDN